MQELIIPFLVVFITEGDANRWNFEEILLKVLIPSVVATAIKLSTVIKSGTKTSIAVVACTAIIGIGTAYLLSQPILTYTSNEWSVATSGAVTFASEHISRWLLYKFKFDIIFDRIGDALIEAFLAWISGRKKN